MKRHCFLLLLAGLPNLFLGAQIVTDFLLEAAKIAAEEKLKETFIVRDRDTTDVDGEGWDEQYRTSEEENERSSQYWSRFDDPPEGLRVGCICMDGSRDDERGTGACAGYGGVRYWLYQISADSIAWYPTKRHWEHPDELNEVELANLASRNRKEKFGAGPGFGSSSWGVYHLLSVTIFCVLLGYIAKLWFASHDKLSD